MKLIKIFLILILLNTTNSFANNDQEFDKWKLKLKDIALLNDISENTFEMVMANVKFLPKVIEYDRFQPEFYEDTKTYIAKRTSQKRINSGINFYRGNEELVKKVETDFDVEKELLLSLMGIETNFGKYVGKMDILSSLATLSFDKRRSEFFTQ